MLGAGSSSVIPSYEAWRRAHAALQASSKIDLHTVLPDLMMHWAKSFSMMGPDEEDPERCCFHAAVALQEALTTPGRPYPLGFDMHVATVLLESENKDKDKDNDEPTEQSASDLLDAAMRLFHDGGGPLSTQTRLQHDITDVRQMTVPFVLGAVSCLGLEDALQLEDLIRCGNEVTARKLAVAYGLAVAPHFAVQLDGTIDPAVMQARLASLHHREPAVLHDAAALLGVIGPQSGGLVLQSFLRSRAGSLASHARK